MIPNSKAAARQPVPVGLVRFGAGSPPSVATASVASASTAAVIDLPSGKQMPDWPQVPCASCSQLSHWKDNRQDQVWMGQRGEDDVNEDGQWVVNYYCVKCVAKEMGDVEDQVARAYIRGTRRDMQKRMLRTADYKKALQNPPQTMEFEHGTRKERRVITRRQMLVIWRPAAHAILLKAAQMKTRANHGDKHAALLEQMKRDCFVV